MKVTYLGNKKNMAAHGYDFSGGPVDVPESDNHAIKKFKGNRYFYCDHPDNQIAPKFYVYAIDTIDLPSTPQGKEQFTRKKSNKKGPGFQTEGEAEMWITAHGGEVNRTHYIMRSDEGIREAREEDKKPTEESAPVVVGIFRRKTDGELHKIPDKAFHGEDKEKLVTEANEYLEAKGIDPADREIMVR